MAFVEYRAISVGGEKGDKYAIFKHFKFVPMGKDIVVCDINNKKIIPIKWINYTIQIKKNGKVFKSKYLHFFKKSVILDGFILKMKNKNQKLFRYQSAASVISKLPHDSKLSAIQFTA